MADTVTGEDCSSEMVRITSLATVRTKDEGIEASLLTHDIQRCYVGEHVVDPVTVRRVLLRIPDSRDGELAEKSALDFALVIDAVEADDSL